jgi:hypothetical protein
MSAKRHKRTLVGGLARREDIGLSLLNASFGDGFFVQVEVVSRRCAQLMPRLIPVLFYWAVCARFFWPK